MKEPTSFKKVSVQIDLFGMSALVLTQEKLQYLFYLEWQEQRNCYLKSKKSRSKKWSDANLLRANIDPQARFMFTDENEFGFAIK